MFRNILLTMSISGSIVILLYLLFYSLAKKYFPLIWRYQLLKVAIFFYLVPIAKCKYYLFGIFERLFPGLWKKIYAVQDLEVKYSIAIDDKFMQLSPRVYYMVCILVLCGIVSVFIFFKIVIQNQRLKKIYLDNSSEAVDQELNKIFLEIKKELKIKRKIKLVCSSYCVSPVTYGIFFPVVWFPVYDEKKLNSQLLRYIVKHELLHVKRKDSLVNYMGLLVIAVHWFNPLSYFLFHELSCIGEMYCDSGVLEGQGEDERREYSELLLQIAVKKTHCMKQTLFMGMANNKKRKIR